MAETPGGRLVINGPEEPERITALDRAVMRIGRAPEPQNEIVLSHSWVSRAHARLFCDRLPYRIQDMGSSNGTLLNDAPLSPNEIRPLKDGDVVAIGPFRLRFEAPHAPAVETPPEREKPAEEPIAGVSVRAAPPAGMPPPFPPATAEGPSVRAPERWVGTPDGASRWLQYLPAIYADDEFLGRFLLICEDLLGPVQQLISHFDLFLDPATAPEPFLPWLNEWLAALVDEHWSPQTQRLLLKNASWLHQARGTRAGLLSYLQIVCPGCEAEITENAQGPHSFEVVLHADDNTIDRLMVERVIEANRPAHTSYTLKIV
jgi:phage tail-like protein